MYTATGRTSKADALRQYAPLVRRLAGQMLARLPASVELDDLVQAGMMGLLDALGRYEETQGVQFEAYASQRIRGAILDELRSNDWLPRGLRKQSREIEKAIQKATQQVGRAPTEREIAAALGVSLTEYQEYLVELQGSQLLYYEDFDRDDAEAFINNHTADATATPLAQLIDQDTRLAVIEAIDQLSDREKLMMSLYYEQELNLREIGAVMGVSESRVSQLHSQAVARIRAKLRAREEVESA
jgi:RNA polymerase sigma factor for flagellar operon FliA